MERLILAYYQDLYSAPAASDERAEAEAALLAKIPSTFSAKFSDAMIASLGRPPE